MRNFIANDDGTMPTPATFLKSDSDRAMDRHYENIARQMKRIFPETKAIVADIQSLKESGAVAGDIIYCPHRLCEPALAWILLDAETGDAELLGSDKIENLEWYFYFGTLEVLQKPDTES